MEKSGAFSSIVGSPPRRGLSPGIVSAALWAQNWALSPLIASIPPSRVCELCRPSSNALTSGCPPARRTRGARKADSAPVRAQSPPMPPGRRQEPSRVSSNSARARAIDPREMRGPPTYNTPTHCVLSFESKPNQLDWFRRIPAKDRSRGIVFSNGSLGALLGVEASRCLCSLR